LFAEEKNGKYNNLANIPRQFSLTRCTSSQKQYLFTFNNTDSSGVIFPQYLKKGLNSCCCGKHAFGRHIYTIAISENSCKT
jgi:hypothetical protein